MNFDKYDYFGNIRGVALPIPTSFRALPPLPIPDKQQWQAAGDLERSFIKQSGILPGTYTKFDDVRALIDVHKHMWDNLESELTKFDNLAICQHLYQKLEIILGHINEQKYHSTADQFLTGRTQGSGNRIDIWQAITPTTEGIKFLLEMAIKYCSSSGWINGTSQLDFLIGLSSRIVILDEYMETIYGRIIPYEITITPNFDISSRISDQAKKAVDEFIKYQKVHAAQADQDFMETLDRVKGPKIKIDEFRSFPEIIPVDKAMAQELGYGLFDWLNYASGCMDLFNEDEYFKIIGVQKLKKHLKNKFGLNPEKVELLLQDHALSQAIVKDLSRDDVMPIENYKRDSRLLRRPLLEINHGEARIALMGIETFSIGTQVFFTSLEYGSLQIPRMQENGPLKSAMGIISGKIGDPFRDNIASKCRGMGFKAETEWSLPVQDKTDEIVGPIDILVIDHKKKRFILVEAKNLQDPGIVPKEMKGQRDKFLGDKVKGEPGFIQVLKDKQKAFASNKKLHLHRLKMEGLEEYTVESVIIVFYPTFWPLVHSEPLPILDDLEFFKRLQSGQDFLTPHVV